MLEGLDPAFHDPGREVARGNLDPDVPRHFILAMSH